MDVAGLSVSMSQISNMGKIGIAVLDKTMESGEDLAAGMLKMIDAAAMERSVNPAVGGQMDIRI
ncbi:MAG: YjfB family protein [Lachnospiraceae bacterium]|nr:YjfB family protein [Lachnospiraceae bacterium]MDE6129699.1 YjfB family protein [Lachnospiraceae bacterium]